MYFLHQRRSAWVQCGVVAEQSRWLVFVGGVARVENGAIAVVCSLDSCVVRQLQQSRTVKGGYTLTLTRGPVCSTLDRCAVTLTINCDLPP
ncbi:hypothetical protein Trydic_g11794 [Trypoxylus dichotomus]